MIRMAARAGKILRSFDLLRLATVLTVAAISVLLVNAWLSFWSIRAILERDFTIARLSGQISLLDEVLTMSARMAAATGDSHWTRRYMESEGELDALIRQAIAVTPGPLAEQVRKTQQANERLVEVERRSIELATRGELEEARRLVSGDAYEGWKQQYGAGLGQLVKLLDEQTARSVISARRWATASTFAAALGIIVCFGVFAAEVARYRREQSLRYELALLLRRSTVERVAIGLAHELGQPLAAIGHFADAGLSILDSEADPAQVGQVLKGIREQAERAGAIVQQTRAFAAPNRDRRIEVDLSQVLKQVEMLMRSHAKQHGVDMVFDRPSAPVRVMGESVQLQQLIVNLVLNAIESCTEVSETRCVRVVLEAIDRTARIAVRDSGRGIDLQAAHRIFDAFYSGKPDGLGLGLAIARDIAEAHGGSITLEPVEAGACFVVDLPRLCP